MKRRLTMAVMTLLAISFASCGRDAALSSAVKDEVLIRAAADLDIKPETVTSAFCPRSLGGLHDFYSEGDYWWPDPDNPDGPYIRRDGLSNPDNFSEHRHAMVAFSIMVGNFASAWILTGDGRYPQAAEKHLRAWFIDEDTMMNPSLLYAQAIKGRHSGRGIGIIDTIHLMEVARAVKIFADARVISDKCAQGCKTWFAGYLDWMTTHPYGLDEKAATNNHGTWWFAQAAAFASLTGNEGVLRMCADAYRQRFLPETTAEDGSYPLELARTKPYGYSLFQLDAMAILCQILSNDTDNLWEYTTPDGKNIRKSLDFMLPYVENKSLWPYPQDVAHWDEWPVAIGAYALGWMQFGERRYLKVWTGNGHFPSGDEMRRNVVIRNPLIWL